MAWTKAKLDRYIKEGRGQGEGINYIPWIKIHEFSSKGRATRIHGLKTNRIHHLHSDNQLRAFLLFEWSDKVIDIRESYPLLDLMEVVDKKDDLRLDRFVDKETGEPYILTTNFLVTMQNEDGDIEYFARAIKNYSELNKKSTIEKFEIERRYWLAKGVNWKVVTNKEINRQFCKNIEWVRETLIQEGNGVSEIEKLSEELVFFFRNSQQIRIKDLLKQFEDINELDIGVGLYLFRYLIGKKLIQIDMRNKIDINKKVEDLIVSFNYKGV